MGYVIIDKRVWQIRNSRLRKLSASCRHEILELVKEDVQICFDNNGMHDPICISMAEEAQDMEEYLG